jgi:hypothetical protein
MAATAPEEMMFGRRTKFTRGMKVFVAITLLILAALITIIVFPITETTPAWVEPLQTNVYGFMARISPYILVGLLGATVATAELVSTFQTYPREALRTRWAWVLILVNVVAAMIALVVVRVTMTEMNPSLQVLSVGVGFQATGLCWPSALGMMAPKGKWRSISAGCMTSSKTWPGPKLIWN